MKKVVIFCCMVLIPAVLLPGISLINKNKTSNEKDFENPGLIEEMKQAFADGMGNNDYTKANKIVDEINELYPDSYDSSFANVYKEAFSNSEQEKNNSENAEVKEEIDYKKYMQLLSVNISEPNSAGGIDLYIKWKNTSDKTIKYIYFTCALYNAVDDMVEDTISRDYLFTGQITGPIEPGTVYGENKHWQNAWWNNSGKYAKITEVKVEYMDGDKIEIPEKEVDKLFY